jgi:NADH dehydrogenase/NADH:ubiquinone oxidoreductase subunit G
MAKLTTTDLTSLANETSAINTINANNALIEAALENTLSRDGTIPNTASADYDMNSNNFLNLANPTIGGNAVNKTYGDANYGGASVIAAAASAAAALVSENAAAADAVLTAADVVSTNADVVTAAASAAAASTSETNAETAETNAAASAAAAAASAAGIFWKEPVLCRSTTNITLSGEQTLDDTLTSTSRVLVPSQTDASENGVYVTAAGAWARAAPLDTWDEHVGAAVIVSEGTAHGDSAWICTVDAGGTLGTTAITWAALSQVYSTATTSSEGIIKTSTAAELTTGTAVDKAVTPDAFTNATNIVTPAHVAGAENAQTGTTYAFVLGDAFKQSTFSNASAVAVTLPLNSSVAFADADRLDLVNLGAGTVTFTAASGVTINGTDGGAFSLEQWKGATLLKTGTDAWAAPNQTVA